MNVRAASENIVNSTLLLAVSRLSMALALPTLGVIAWLGVAWLDQRFDAQTRTIAETAQSVQSLQQSVPAISERVGKLETSNEERADYRRQTLERLDRMEASLVTLSNAVAALTATMDAQRRSSR